MKFTVVMQSGNFNPFVTLWNCSMPLAVVELMACVARPTLILSLPWGLKCLGVKFAQGIVQHQKFNVTPPSDLTRLDSKSPVRRLFLTFLKIWGISQI